MNGIECHFTARLGKDAEPRTTRANKAMTVLTVVVDAKDTAAPTWITVLCFEDLAERLAGLRKGSEVYARGRLKADVYHPEGGEPRPSLTLLATTAVPLVLERKPRAPRRRQAPRRPADDYGDGDPFFDDPL